MDLSPLADASATARRPGRRSIYAFLADLSRFNKPSMKISPMKGTGLYAAAASGERQDIGPSTSPSPTEHI